MSFSKFIDRAATFAMRGTFDGFSNNPIKELNNGFDRTPAKGFHKASSLGGRVVCLIMVPTHLLGIVLKPFFYDTFAIAAACFLPVSIIGTAALGLTNLLGNGKSRLPKEYRPLNVSFSIAKAATCSVVSIPGQIAQACRAVAGVFHPGAYFYKNEYFYRAKKSRQAPVNPSFLTLTINREQLEKAPEQILAYLAAQIKTASKQVLSLHVTFENEQGRDLGGLQRDLFDRLFVLLSDKFGSEEIVALNAETQTDIANLGVVLEMLLRGIDNDDSITETPIPEGSIHHDYFVNMLKFTYEELQGNFNSLSPHRVFQLLSELHGNTAMGVYYSGCSKFLEWDGSANPDTESFEMIVDVINGAKGTKYALREDGSMRKSSLKSVKKKLVSTTLEAATDLKTIHALAKAICRNKSEWEKLQELGADRLENHLMGDSWDSGVFLERITVPRCEKGAALKEWLASLSIPQQKAFARFVTGSGTIPSESQKPFFYLSDTDEKPTAHTCARRVDINEDSSIEDSIAFMNEYFINGTNTQFGIM